MAKTKISEFSSTPANNTDIDSINIAEGCAPSGINDAIRELMAQLKDFQTGAVGDSFNGPIGTSTAAAGAFTTLSATGAITSTLATGTAPFVIASTTKVANLNVDLLDGADWAAPAALGSTTPAAVSATTLSASSTVTLSGGTANGVAYLNGSKVVTSGSALTFDGTDLATTGGVRNAGSFRSVVSTTDAIFGANQFSSGVVGIGSVSNHPISFNVNLNEQMRLTSTGLGIGTSSPAVKLDVNGEVRSRTTAGFVINDGSELGSLKYSGGLVINRVSGTSLFLQQNSSTQATLDSSGNLGLGVTPSAGLATANYRLFEIGLDGGGSIYSGTNQTLIGTNIAWSGGTPNYKRTGSAPTLYNQQNGAHSWSTAASGTAGNAITFTQAMTLDANGNLALKGTTASSYFDGMTVGSGSTAVGYNIYMGSGTGGLNFMTGTSGGNRYDGYLQYTGSTQALTFGTAGTERARIDSSGNLLVGTTTGQSSKIVSDAGTSSAFWGRTTASATSVSVTWNAATTGDNSFDLFFTETSPSLRGSISYNRTAGLTSYSTTSDYRSKDIIGPVTGSGALIDATPVYMGKMKGATQERPMFIAHETPAYAHTGVKDAVDADGNPVYQQMDASALIPVMWAEIQSLRKRLADAGI